MTTICSDCGTDFSCKARNCEFSRQVVLVGIETRTCPCCHNYEFVIPKIERVAEIAESLLENECVALAYRNGAWVRLM